MKKVLICTDSFKGTLSSTEVCDIIENSLLKYNHNIIVKKIPISDGGENSLPLFINDSNDKYIEKEFTDLNFNKTTSKYLINESKNLAVIEVAETSALTKSLSMDPKITTTYGVGEQILDALDKNIRNFYICLGGSGTNDGGAGLASALGVKYYDINNKEFIPTGGTLINIDKIDISRLDRRLLESKITLICDVKNPPIGKTGATYIYSKQKGATEEDILELEKGMIHYVNLLEKLYSIDLKNLEGAGAAGAIPLSLYAFYNAKIERGIDTIIKLKEIEKELSDTSLLITGEGMLDDQSFMGKVIDGLCSLSFKKGVPSIIVCGATKIKDLSIMDKYNIIGIYPTIVEDIPFDIIKKKARINLANCCDKFAQNIQLLK